MPRITVTIPSYNHEKYIGHAIQSVLDQTCQDFEIVITDDGSSDGTVDVIKTFKDPRIRLYCFDRNQGACVAMNNNIREAKGEYIAVLNSDDMFLPDKLKKQIGYLEKHPEVGAVFGYPKFFDDEGNDFTDPNHPYSKVFRQPNRTRYGWLNYFFYHANALCHPTVLIRKRCYENIGYYDERLAQMPDFDFWIRLCMNYEIHIIPEELIKFRIHASEINASGDRPEARKRLVTEHIQVLKNFLRIKTIDEFINIFPDANKKWDVLDESMISFYISMLALEKDTIMHQNFAISTLFDFLKDHDIRKRLADLYGFSMTDFIRLTGKYDLYNIEADKIVNFKSIVQIKDEELVQKDHQIDQLKKALNRIYSNSVSRFLKKFKQMQDAISPDQTWRRNVSALFLNTIRQKVIVKDPYKLWISKNEPDNKKLRAMKYESQSWSYRPKISIVTPVFNPDKYDLTQCIKSVLNQTYDNWEFCIADGGTDRPYVKKVIKKYADRDPRIKFVFLPENQGISANSNEALKLATGEYIGFLDHDDLLAPFALYEVVKFLNKNPENDFIYSDEDKVPANSSERYGHFFKPNWSPDTFLSYNYICHFAVVRRKIVDEVGGFRQGYDGAQDYDLFLRILQKTSRIKRIPKILYHWRASQGSAASNTTAKLYACTAAKNAIAEYLRNNWIEAEVLDGMFPTSYRVKYRIQQIQKISIIVPTRDKVHLLKQCVSSVLNKTNYKHYELIIVDNQSREEDTIDYFNNIKKDERVKIVSYDKSFNFAAINNYAVTKTDAEYLVFLNNDTEVISSDWLSAMFEFAQRKEVGAIGAKLYYPDNKIQHAGVIIGLRGLAAHSHKGFPNSGNGYMGRLNTIQNVSAVTAACMMMRRKVFEEVGGFDERLSVAFNDVDLCLKIREKGYLIVYTPYAELYHHESASRGIEDKYKERFKREEELMKTKWRQALEAGDPYYNPNSTLEKHDFSPRL